MKVFVAGGAGFIGSHLVETILHHEPEASVTVYDNLSSGKMWHLEQAKDNQRLSIVNGDIKDNDLLRKSMRGADVAYHFAANPDIAKAVTQPDIDFWEGTYLVNNLLEAMRINNVKKLLYMSGSGVYGDVGALEVDENYSPLLPISTYAASKLGCEMMICSYCHMFGMNAVVFRFANVVGPRQTHGVGYDFIKKLMKNGKELEIFGDGKQSKSYIYVTDVISAIRLFERDFQSVYSCYNVATLDYISVTEIADIVTGIMGLKNVKYSYTGGARGWKGDVPVVRMNSSKIRGLGWKNQYSSKEAVYHAVKSMLDDARGGRL